MADVVILNRVNKYLYSEVLGKMEWDKYRWKNFHIFSKYMKKVRGSSAV